MLVPNKPCRRVVVTGVPNLGLKWRPWRPAWMQRGPYWKCMVNLAHKEVGLTLLLFRRQAKQNRPPHLFSTRTIIFFFGRTWCYLASSLAEPPDWHHRKDSKSLVLAICDFMENMTIMQKRKKSIGLEIYCIFCCEMAKMQSIKFNWLSNTHLFFVFVNGHVLVLSITCLQLQTEWQSHSQVWSGK